MNKLSIFTLKALRKLYAKVFNVQPLSKPDCEQDPDVASRIIYDKLMDDQPCMIARFGAFELSVLVNSLGIKQINRNVYQYIKGDSLQWWWNKKTVGYLNTNAGFFPPTQEKIEKFCELMLEDMQELDVLGSWLADEKYFDKDLDCTKIHLRLIEPFWSKEPWTRSLKGKKVLVIHPFAESILKQYNKRDNLFQVKNTLPEFESLTVIKAVQSLGNASDEFRDWFEALESMKNQINQIDFDICLIGAGAYGFPLAAYVKRIGKKSIHIGGALQLLFGIKGKRWEDPNYGVEEWGIPNGFYTSLMNEYWARPII